jgi:hypothetical protein
MNMMQDDRLERHYRYVLGNGIRSLSFDWYEVLQVFNVMRMYIHRIGMVSRLNRY